MDYEAELAIVIKKRCRHVAPERAREHVLGYTCLNDVTARDLQARDGQWTRAKGFDSFCPIGPCIVTDIDPNGVDIETYLNGERKQSSNTKHCIFPIEDVIARVSAVMTLLPGDVIATGTPGGVGPMQPGDKVEVRIEGIGSLKNPVIDRRMWLTVGSDKIFIEDVRFYAHHGVTPAEQTVGAWFAVDVELACRPGPGRRVRRPAHHRGLRPGGGPDRRGRHGGAGEPARAAGGAAGADAARRVPLS